MVLAWMFIFAVVSLVMAVHVIRYRAAVREYERMLANHIEHQYHSLETRCTELKTSLREL